MRPSAGSAGMSKASFLGVPRATAERGPVPRRLPAFTATSYSVPLVRPVMTAPVEAMSLPQRRKSLSPAAR